MAIHGVTIGLRALGRPRGSAAQARDSVVLRLPSMALRKDFGRAGPAVPALRSAQGVQSTREAVPRKRVAFTHGRAFGRPRGSAAQARDSVVLRLPSMALRKDFGRPGPAVPALRSAQGVQSTREAVPRKRVAFTHGRAFGRPRGSAASHRLRPGARCHPWRHASAPVRPARPSLAGRSAGHAAVPRKRPASPRFHRMVHRAAVYVVRIGRFQLQCLRHARAVGRIGLAAVGDMATLDEVRRIAHCARGVVEQHLLLCRRHQAEQVARLLVVVGVVFAEIPEVGVAVDPQRRLAVLRLRLPLAIAVGRVVQRWRRSCRPRASRRRGGCCARGNARRSPGSGGGSRPGGSAARRNRRTTRACSILSGETLMPGTRLFGANAALLDVGEEVLADCGSAPSRPLRSADSPSCGHTLVRSNGW